MNNKEIVANIWGVDNIVIKNELWLEQYISEIERKNEHKDPNSLEKKVDDVVWYIKSLTNEIIKPIQEVQKIKIRDLEKLLKDSYHSGSIYTLWDYRFATSFNVKWTRFERNKDKVIIWNWAYNLWNWDNPTTETNMSGDNYIAVDNLGFSSKSASPTWGYLDKQAKDWTKFHDWYGFLWKVSELRPVAEEFDKEEYEKIMNTEVKVSFTWYAVEDSDAEIAIMPTFRIEWEEIELLMKKYSHPKDTDDWKKDIPTSKMWLSENN